jgi:DNA-binding response OmpR family regulator
MKRYETATGATYASSMMRTVLVVASTAGGDTSLDGALGERGLRQIAVNDLASALRLATETPVDALAILNRIEGSSPTDLVRRVRAARALSSLPVLVVGEVGDEIERTVAYELGADDVLAPGASTREVALRLEVVLRRVHRPRTAVTGWESFGGIELDRTEQRVRVGGIDCDLVPSCYALLLALLNPPGAVHTRATLLQTLHRRSDDSGSRWIDARVARLREALGPAGGQVETVRGEGYRLRTHVET